MNATAVNESPYLSIWWRPRRTIRAIVDSNPRSMVLVLAMIPAFLSAINRWVGGNHVAFTIGRVAVPSTLPRTWFLVNLALLAALPLLAIAMLYINGALIRWAGAQMGGTATSVEVRAAIAWSIIPVIVSDAIYLALVSAGDGMPKFHRDNIVPLLHWMGRFGWIFGALFAWQFIISLKCIGEVHRFSAWKALAAQLIVLLMLLGAVAALAMLVPLVVIPFLRA